MADDLSTEEILQRVAAGTLDPAEAAAMLDENEPTDPPARDTVAGDVSDAAVSDNPVSDHAVDSDMVTRGDHVYDVPADDALIGRTLAAEEPTPPSTQRLLVRATSRRVRIIGDPTVATVAVEGEHTARREDGTLVISGESAIGAPDDAFVLLAGRRWGEAADRAAKGIFRDLELLVRVRPDLPVGVEVIAGSVHVERASAVDHVRVTAGSLRAADLERPVDVLVQAGSAQLSGRLRDGKSRVRCESGSITIGLTEGSDIRVKSDVQLGRVVTVPERTGRDRGRDIVVGGGAGEMDLEVVMGQVTVRVPDHEGVYQ